MRRRHYEGQLRADRVWKYSGVPPEFEGYTLETWVDANVAHGGSIRRAKRLVAGLRAWVNGETEFRNLGLLGEVGIGKSGLATALMWERGRQGASVYFVRLGDAMLRLRSTFGHQEQKDETELSIITMLDYRYLNKLPTIITANVNRAGDLETVVGDAAYSRLMYQALTFDMDDLDLRTRVDGLEKFVAR
jgi:DNA replication protein DnaC